MQIIQEPKTVRNGVEMPIACILREAKEDREGFSSRVSHTHEYIEFLFGLEECDVVTRMGEQEVHFGTGELLMIRSNQGHAFCHRLPLNRYICIKVMPEVLSFVESAFYDVKYTLPFLRDPGRPYCFFDRTQLEGSGVPETILHMMEEWDSLRYGYEVAMKSHLLQLFLWLLRQESPVEEPGGNDERMLLIRRSLEYVRENYADIDERQAAAAANVSYSYYSRLFRSVVGKSFRAYLTDLRIRESERLLLSTDLSVTEIALATGFATGSYFIQCFRLSKGVTPFQYRKQYQKASFIPSAL